MSGFPIRRLRRLRRSAGLRALVQETRVSAGDLILPMFVVEDPAEAGEVPTMPGVRRFAVDDLQAEVAEVMERGLKAVLLFGVPSRKDARGSSATVENGVVPQAIQRIKQISDTVVVITDVCLCSYTDHGHCGLLADGQIANDASVAVLGQMALSHARAGADVVAPSAMLDGMVAGIRAALDNDGYADTPILSYAVKYASSFYGPFRDAAACAPKSGDRRGHQMDPANVREAIAEAASDLDEGADMLMVKPGMPYLDVIALLRQRFPQAPLAAYQVSGEYAMIKAAARHGWLDEQQVVTESLTSLKRAGADMIITYFSKQAAEWLDH